MVGFLVLLIRGLPRFKMDAPVFLVPDKRLLAGFTVAFFGVTIFVEARALDSGFTAERERQPLVRLS